MMQNFSDFESNFLRCGRWGKTTPQGNSLAEICSGVITKLGSLVKINFSMPKGGQENKLAIVFESWLSTEKKRLLNLSNKITFFVVNYYYYRM